jgi:cAMP-binding proteins - catabolite gene activator and regulatory subunit of cAMP-dependent protein kinases
MQYLNPYIELCLEGSPSIFKGLNQKDKEALIHQHTLVIIKKGQFLFKEGEKSRGLICLASGKVKVFKDGVGGRGQILRMVRQLGFIGYKALFSDNPWPVSAIAIEDSAICIFEKNSFVRILKKNPDLTMKFIKVIADELVSSNNRTVSLTQKHIRGRLAESLLILRDTYGYDADGKTIRISMSREDIANLSNMTTSNAIRTLSNLATEGIIELTGRRIRILDSNYLEHISELG